MQNESEKDSNEGDGGHDMDTGNVKDIAHNALSGQVRTKPPYEPAA